VRLSVMVSVLDAMVYPPLELAALPVPLYN